MSLRQVNDPQMLTLRKGIKILLNNTLFKDFFLAEAQRNLVGKLPL